MREAVGQKRVIRLQLSCADGREGRETREVVKTEESGLRVPEVERERAYMLITGMKRSGTSISFNIQLRSLACLTE